MNKFLALLFTILSKIIEWCSSQRTKVESSMLVNKKIAKVTTIQKKVKRHSSSRNRDDLTKED